MMDRVANFRAREQSATAPVGSVQQSPGRAPFRGSSLSLNSGGLWLSLSEPCFRVLLATAGIQAMFNTTSIASDILRVPSLELLSFLFCILAILSTRFARLSLFFRILAAYSWEFSIHAPQSKIPWSLLDAASLDPWFFVFILYA